MVRPDDTDKACVTRRTGEVFVLDDGGEVDLDLGNYERFIDIKLSRDNNITTGKIYQVRRCLDRWLSFPRSP